MTGDDSSPPETTPETMTAREKRLRRLAMRSWRRGIKEMDLILGQFWNAAGTSLTDAELDLYEDLLVENDQELYAWCSGKTNPPSNFAPLITRIMQTVQIDQ